MHPLTTASITATEYTNGIFLQIHMFIFFRDLDFASIGMHAMNILFCIFGDFYASGMQDTEVNKVTAYFFFCMDKRLLEHFVLKCNQ